LPTGLTSPLRAHDFFRPGEWRLAPPHGFNPPSGGACGSILKSDFFKFAFAPKDIIPFSSD